MKRLQVGRAKKQEEDRFFMSINYNEGASGLTVRSADSPEKVLAPFSIAKKGESAMDGKKLLWEIEALRRQRKVLQEIIQTQAYKRCIALCLKKKEA